MPIKKKDWAKIFQALAIGGQTISGLQQLKDIQAQQEADEQAAKVKAEFLAKRLKDPANVQMVGGTPMVAPSGKPLGATVLSGMYDKYQRPADMRLLEQYRQLDETPPEWLKARIKPIEQVTAPHVPPKKEKPKEPTELDKLVKAHLAVQQGTATPEQTILVKLRPLPDTKRKEIKDIVSGEQGKWDKNVRNFVNQDKNDLPLMRDLLLKKGVTFISQDQAPEDWDDENWKAYTRETLAVTNIFGARPEMPEDPELVKAKQKLDSGEWDQATYNDFLSWYGSE
jgi:hypothetical protein